MGWFEKLIRKIFGIGDPHPVPPEPPLPPGPPAPPEPGVPFQAVECRVVLEVDGLASLPLSMNRDDFVLFALTWEDDGRPDPTVPILGVHIRGTSQKDAGFITRWSPNIRHDQLAYAQYGEDEHQTGGGQNFHQRLPSGDGLWTVTWNRERIDVTSPLGAVQSLVAKVPGSIGFGAIVTVLWERRVNRYHLWKGFEASIHGVTVKLKSWTGKAGTLVRIE